MSSFASLRFASLRFGILVRPGAHSDGGLAAPLVDSGLSRGELLTTVNIAGTVLYCTVVIPSLGINTYLVPGSVVYFLPATRNLHFILAYQVVHVVYT